MNLLRYWFWRWLRRPVVGEVWEEHWTYHIFEREPLALTVLEVSPTDVKIRWEYHGHPISRIELRDLQAFYRRKKVPKT